MTKIWKTLLLIIVVCFTACQNSNTTTTKTSSNTNTSVKEPGISTTSIKGLTGWERGIKMGKQDKIEEEGTYLNGKREGAWTTYHSRNGLVSTITHYKDGLKNGALVQANDRGEIELVAYYINGELEGAYKKFIRSKIKEESFYSNGKLEGMRKQFYDDGSIQVESNYVNGKRDGFEKYYDQEGNVTIEYEYKNGDRVKK